MTTDTGSTAFDALRQRIKDEVELVDLVQEQVAVHRRGRLQVACCPFHSEKTPSFTIYADTQHYKCYGCGVSGDVFTFVMEREGLSFREAMEVLAERIGASVDGVFKGRRGKGGDPRRTAHENLEPLVELFQGFLEDPETGGVAQDYLERRGLLLAAREFGLGYHPSRAQLREFARQRGLSLEVLGQAGLLNRDGHEPMRDRVVFPIRDERGRCVGFGGRVLPRPAVLGDTETTPDAAAARGAEGADHRPKYRNSPESPFFNKRRLLYGLRQVKEAGTRQVVVVEGYTDVIALHLAGFSGAVATLGTALTEDHGKLLERYATEGVVLLFDGDQAGRRAADRAFRELVHTPLDVRIALLPDGVDPADLAAIEPRRDDAERDVGRERLAELIDGAEDALSAWFRILRAEHDLSRDANVQRVAGECGRILAGVDNPARRDALRRAMAARLGLSDPAAIQIPKRKVRRDERVAGPAGDSRTQGAGSQNSGVPGGASPGGSGWGDDGAPLPDVDDELLQRDVADLPPMDAPARPRSRPRAPSRVEQADVDLLAMVLKTPELVDRARGLPGRASAWLEAFLGQIATAREKGAVEHSTLVPRLFDACVEDPTARTALAEAVDRAARLGEVAESFARLEKGRSRLVLQEEARRLRAEVQDRIADGDSAAADEATRKYQDVMRRLREAGGGSA